MSLSIIRATLMQKLATWAAAYSPALLIAREGVPFPPAPLTQKPDLFLEAILIPTDTVAWSVDATSIRYRGIFQVNIWTKDNIGVGVAETIAQGIATLFPVVPKSMLPVSIESVPSAHRAILDGTGFRVIAVTMDYRMDSH